MPARLKVYNYETVAVSRGIRWVGGQLPPNNRTKTLWACEDGHEFEAIYKNVRDGQGCPFCSQSKGERIAAETLVELGISFEREVRFDGMVYKRPLRVDFYIPGADIVIEVHGSQHYKAWGGNRAELEAQIERDRVKKEFCERVGLTFIEINDGDVHKLATILEQYL